MKLNILAAFFLGCITTAFAAGEDVSRIARFFKTTENLHIVSSPESVDVCILYPDLAPGEKFSQKTKEGIYKPVSRENSALLGSKLTDETSYIWNAAKACMPAYNARIRFHRGSSVISADFCFGCKIVRFSRDGFPINSEDFDPIYAEAFEIVRATFPDDQVVLSVIAEVKRLEEWKLTHPKAKKGSKAPREPCS